MDFPFSIWQRNVKYKQIMRLTVNSIYFSLAILFVAFNVAFSQTTVTLKVGVVDSEIILSQLPEYKKAQEQLSNIVKTWQDELDSLSMLYQEKMENYRKQEAIMSEDAKLKGQQEIIKLEQDILNYRQKRFGQQGDLAQKQEELLNPIKQNIIKAIEKVAKEEKVTLVLDKAGEVVVLYSDPTYDLTFKVLDQLRRGRVK